MTDTMQLTLRTAPRTADLNINGNIFGGWVLSQMDIAGGIVAARRAGGRVATVAVEGMKFHRPIELGDVVNIHTRIEKVGRTSINVFLEVTADRGTIGNETILVTSGHYIFVAVDDKGQPRPVDQP
ncbi:acyl-CoA thioesterase [Pseudokordiimonas caeni]|uniref:acyl-CoA thioesterase n=1 Tax=Pseudokordiimonas caeni TaxID=2997908 RepID=UPI0028128C4B|nr:acyl-CoA thioesterase [Pseudokordiimonas caeni]